MRLCEESEFKNQRVAPNRCWNELTGDFLTEAMGDIYHNREKLLACYAAARQLQEDEDDYPKQIIQHVLSSQRQSAERKLFIIYGPPGIGKTTYLANVFRQRAEAEAANHAIVPIFFDLRNTSDFDKLPERFAEHVFEEFIDVHPLFKEDAEENTRLRAYAEVFKDRLKQQVVGFEWKRFSSFVKQTGNRDKLQRVIEERYLANRPFSAQLLSRFIASKNSLIPVFIIDNFDHQEGNLGNHARVFAFVKQILFDYGFPVFMPMRNYTYADSYDRYGFIEADRVRTKALSVPKLEKVFQRRKEYILANIGNNIEVKMAGKRFEISPDSMRSTVEETLAGVFNTPENMHFLQGISGDNCRVFLDMVANVISSGHITVNQNTTKVPFKSFLRASMCANHLVFRPQDRRVPVINVFDNEGPVGSKNTLVRIRILQLLRDISSSMTVADICNELSLLQYSSEIVKLALRRMLEQGLLKETPYYQGANKMTAHTELELDPIGIYYLEELAVNHVYFEIMTGSINLPIVMKRHLVNLAPTNSETKVQHDKRFSSLRAVVDWVREFEIQDEKQFPQLDYSKRFYRISDSIESRISDTYIEG